MVADYSLFLLFFAYHYGAHAACRTAAVELLLGCGSVAGLDAPTVCTWDIYMPTTTLLLPATCLPDAYILPYLFLPYLPHPLFYLPLPSPISTHAHCLYRRLAFIFRFYFVTHPPTHTPPHTRFVVLPVTVVVIDIFPSRVCLWSLWCVQCVRSDSVVILSINFVRRFVGSRRAHTYTRARRAHTHPTPPTPPPRTFPHTPPPHTPHAHTTPHPPHSVCLNEIPDEGRQIKWEEGYIPGRKMTFPYFNNSIPL